MSAPVNVSALEQPDKYQAQPAVITTYIEDDGSISSEENVVSTNDFDYSPNRSRHAQNPWDLNLIQQQLENLPSAENVYTQIKSSESFELSSTAELRTVLLLSAWLGKQDAIQWVLDLQPALVNTTDNFGLTAIHLSSLSNHANCLQTLLRHGAEVNIREPCQNATGLHMAASRGNADCIRVLLEHGADVNIGLSNSRSPLHYAVENNEIECVRILLESGAIPNTPQIFSETPLHIAAAQSSVEIVHLLLAHGAAVNVKFGPAKLTPLHLACEDGDAECAKLLLQAGAQISARNYKKQTPLHLAALSQSSATLKLLLQMGADPNTQDQDGRTALHSAIVKTFQSTECVRILLHHNVQVNMADNFGYTALHLAALNEFPDCVLLLLDHGGDITARTNGGISVLTFITRKIPEVLPHYVDRLDHSIKITDHELGDIDCEIKLDFRILVPNTGQKETDLLLKFIEVNRKDILQHPLCETFLFLKWHRIRKFFILSLLYHMFIVFLYSAYVIGVFLKDCPQLHRSVLPNQSKCEISSVVTAFGYILLVLNIMLLCKEIFQVAHCWRGYIKYWDNWLQWLIIISIFCCVQPYTDTSNIRISVANWQHHVAAIGIFSTWLELMMIVGRFPIFGLYIQMFTTVALNFIKFIAAYCCLLFAFTLSFGVLFANYVSFRDLKWAIIKVVVMMSGELEYEDVFFDDKSPIEYQYTAQIMFLLFVLLVTIILTNLLVGLAVNDIQGLQRCAGLDRLVRHTELVAHLESILFSRLLKYLPHKITKFFHQQSTLVANRSQSSMYIRPNDPRESKIPRPLARSIYELMVSQKNKERKLKIEPRKYKMSSNRFHPSSKSCSDTELHVDGDNEQIIKKLIAEFQATNRRVIAQIERMLVKQ